MFKKTVLSICAAGLLCTSIVSTTPRQAYAGATEAYIAHTTISAALMPIGLAMALKRIKMIKVPIFPESAVPVWAVINIFGMLAPLAQAAITQWMDKSGKILAKFTGATGHVTDKWVGAPEINKTIEVINDFASELNDVELLSRLPEDKIHDAYVNAHSDYKNATSADLAEALTNYQVASDQSNTPIQQYYQKILYTAQQQAIWGMVEALYMKKTFAILAKVHKDTEDAIQNQYQNTKSTLATLAARRALFNALLIVKYQVARARTRLRSEALKVYLKPIAEPPSTEK